MNIRRQFAEVRSNLLANVLTVIMFVAAAPTLRAAEAPGLKTWTLLIDGVERTALVYIPIQSPASPPALAPLVFVFHGHGGTSKFALRQFHFDTLWPQAISVYPQGLNTPGQLLDANGQSSGWQHANGQLNDRDLHFFDALLAKLKHDLPVDEHHVFVTGHSNGGSFTYLLWKARPEVFAAVAPCSAAATYAAELKPKPSMISGGTHDPLVKFAWTQQMITIVRKLNGCEADGVRWEDAATLYPSPGGTPLVAFTYPGSHTMDKAEAGLIVKFFQEQMKPTPPR